MKAEQNQTGFQRILEAIASRIEPGMTLRCALEDILTLGGRQPFSFGVQSLSADQAALLEIAPDAALGSATAAVAEGGEAWYLGIWNYGRVLLSREAVHDAECRVLGTLAIAPQTAAAVLRRTQAIRQDWARCDAQVDVFYAGLGHHALHQVLDAVHEAVDHTDPVLLYVGEATISNFGKFNNLQERSGADLPHCFFRRVWDMPLAAWTQAERVFVFCFHWLRVAGCRGEEFNGRQMNAAALDNYFDMRLAQYRGLQMNVPVALISAAPSSIAEKAALLARNRAHYAGEMLSYRAINGLNFCKEECMLRRSVIRLGLPALSPRLRQHLAQAHGVVPERHDTLGGLFSECVEHMAESGFGSDEAGLNAAEKLLKIMTEEAIEATASDIGMTRGIRDLACWQQAFREQRYEDICNWAAADYFCGVFPGAALLEQLRDTPEHLIKILSACSVRMQFNSWHYMPGHCPREAVPAKRHFYYPPRLPDIAAWSDQHHAGHVLAEVRYSIRSPAALELDGKTHPGMIDLRLFRQRGHAYGEAELLQVLAFTELLRAFNQALSDYIDRSGQVLRLAAFDKEWFRRYYGAPVESLAAPEIGAAVVPGLGTAMGSSMARVRGVPAN